MSSSCSSSGIAWAISRARAKSASTDPNGRAIASRPRNPRAPSNSGATAAANAPGAMTSSRSIDSGRRDRPAIRRSVRRGPWLGHHQPPASRMSRWRTRAATSRRYSAVERTSSIGCSSAASVSAAQVGGLGRRRAALEAASVAVARIGVAATDPSASRTSVQGEAGLPSRQPSATTTLLIDWARRVPTLRKRSSRPASSGIRMRSSSSSGARAVLPVGRPELGGRDRPLAADGAQHERRVGGEQDRQRVAGRARHWRCCRRASRGSGSGPRRSSRPPRPARGDARDRPPSAGSPCRSSGPRG